MILTLFLCAAFAVFSGCVKKADPPSPPPPQIDPHTDELIVHLPAFRHLAPLYAKSIEKYKQIYPQTKVTLVKIGDADDYPGAQGEYHEHIERALAAGDGPDVILPRYIDGQLKKMEDGAFLDLSYYADNDAEFDASELNAAVYNAGVYLGARYFIPLAYELNILLAERSALDNIRFDLSRDADFVSFFNEIADCLPTAAANPDFTRMFDRQCLYYFVACAGLTVYDRENERVLPDRNAVKNFCEAYKPYYSTDFSGDIIFEVGFEGLLNGSHFFHIYDYSLRIFYDYSRLKDLGFEPAFTAVRTLGGGLEASANEVIAVRAGSKNAANAWDLIKIMLSEEMQYSNPTDANGTMAFPVNTKALSRQIDFMLRRGMEFGFGTADGNIERHFCPAVPEEDKVPYRALHDAVTDCALYDRAFDSAFFYYMSPYFKDEKSYDECIDEFVEYMEELLSGAAL